MLYILIISVHSQVYNKEISLIMPVTIPKYTERLYC
jgi:hypothetical protein